MQKVCEAFMELSRDLRKLKDIPLSVTSLQGTSPTFRGTEVNKKTTIVVILLSTCIHVWCSGVLLSSMERQAPYSNASHASR